MALRSQRHGHMVIQQIKMIYALQKRSWILLLVCHMQTPKQMGNAKNLKDYHVEIKLIHPTKKLEKKMVKMRKILRDWEWDPSLIST